MVYVAFQEVFFLDGLRWVVAATHPHPPPPPSEKLSALLSSRPVDHSLMLNAATGKNNEQKLPAREVTDSQDIYLKSQWFI